MSHRRRGLVFGTLVDTGGRLCTLVSTTEPIPKTPVSDTRPHVLGPRGEGHRKVRERGKTRKYIVPWIQKEGPCKRVPVCLGLCVLCVSLPVSRTLSPRPLRYAVCTCRSCVCGPHLWVLVGVGCSDARNGAFIPYITTDLCLHPEPTTLSLSVDDHGCECHGRCPIVSRSVSVGPDRPRCGVYKE